MPVKMREGMLYWTRSGTVWGPFTKGSDGTWWLMEPTDDGWRDDGSYSRGKESKCDLVAEALPCPPQPPRPIEIKEGNFVEMRNGAVAGPIVYADKELTYKYRVGSFSWTKKGRYISTETSAFDVVWTGTASELADRLKARTAP